MVKLRQSPVIPSGKVAVVSHDAGGAEVVSSWLRRNGIDYRAVLDGPARKTFQSKFSVINEASLVDAIEECEWILTGASWQSDLEIKAIKLGREKGRLVATFLDHWVNYKERFQRNGTTILPDQVWVGDEYAFSIAQQELAEIPVLYCENPYFLDTKAEILEYAKENIPNQLTILFVAENISAHGVSSHSNPRQWGYTELDAIRFFFDNVEKIDERKICQITIRPHPTEIPDKYHWLLTEYSHLPIKMSSNNVLAKDIALHQWIVGCNSTAMIIGLRAGKRVLSSIPRGGRPSVLPHSNIEDLSRILSNLDGT